MTARVEPFDVSLWPEAPMSPAWRLRTDHFEVTAVALGAHLIDVRVPVDGDWVRISVDYPAIPNPTGFHGATAGRWANRIAGSAFELDGERHELVANEGPNQLHGGPDGFDRRLWSRVELVDDGEAAGVVLSLVSPDGDQGFPGELEATARFVASGDRLSITYEASTDRPTVVNLTNHLYWNLAGGGSLDGHHLTVFAERRVPVDEANLPLAGPPLPVTGTRFDCRAGVDLGAVVAAGGFDHCFVFGADPAAPGVRLEHDSGRAIEVHTDQVGCQIYTGRHLDADRRGVAIEAQRIPDGPNRPDLGPAVLRPGERYRNHTVVRFGG